MAMGNCLTEEYIVEDGVPWSTLLARYKMPSIKHAPEIVSRLVEHPLRMGRMGPRASASCHRSTPPGHLQCDHQRDRRAGVQRPGRPGRPAARDQGGQKEVKTTWHDVR